VYLIKIKTETFTKSRVRAGMRMSALGQKADIAAHSCDVRFTPKSRHRLSLAGCPLCAKSGREQVQQIRSSDYRNFR
jgi:hypothetical protein